MKNSKLVLIALMIIVVMIAGLVISRSKLLSTSGVCTTEAKLCPDGSAVGRSGAQCEFSPCPIVNTGTPPPPTLTASGISGVVLLGPTCPVMRNPPDPGCADKFYQTNLLVMTADGSRVVKTFSSDQAGKFKVNVPVGEYTIQSANSANILPRCNSNDLITVKINTFTDTTVYCDTGIR